MKTMERFCYLGILSLVAIYILVFLPENSPIILDSSSSSYSASREIDDIQLSESFETKKSFQETSRLNEKHPENYDLIRTFCDMKFRNGLMCPPLYTELGASCSYNGSKAVCTDVRLKAKYSLRKSQLAITRMLGIFDLIASRHNITYWLTSGTLLGAVRHKGFIPWDSDADIEMPLKDYEKFFRIASHDLPSDVFFQNTESDPNLRPEQSYLYEGYKYKDIGMYIRIWNPRLRDTHSCNKVCLMYDCKFHDGLMVDMFIAESAPNGTFPLRDVLFEGLHFPVPNNYREVLSKLYGNDYMDVPTQGSKKRVQWDYPDPLLSCEEFKNLVERRKRNLKKKKLARKTHANSMESLRYLDLRRKNGGNSVVLK